MQVDSTSLKAVEREPFEITSRTLKCGLLECRIRSASNRTRELIQTLPHDLHRYLVVNRKRFGEGEMVGWKQASGDLFEMAPAEVREGDSLFVGNLDLEVAEENGLKKYLALDTTMVLLSALEPTALLEKQKMAWAWYSRPSIFQMQMVHGSETLAKILFAGVSHVLMRDRSSEDLLIYSYDEL